MIIAEAINWSNKKLIANKVDSPHGSTNLLLSELLKVDKAYLIAHPEKELSKSETKMFKNWIERRVKHEPVWYIVGKIDFMGCRFVVNKNVLIPRPETELLIEKFISDNSKNILPDSRLLEIGTGSGVIIISLANRLKCQYFASDISEKSLQVAQKNIDVLKRRTNILFKKGNLFEPWGKEKFDYILVNLPYIPHKQLVSLSLDILKFEPEVALDGGEDGLDIYTKFLFNASNHLNKKGIIYGEIGDQQGEKISELANRYLSDTETQIIKDYGGYDRIFIIQKH